ncbi:MAG TPA: hypothetical protein VK604_23750 [Bryobacteraceae bacterium]|nr:hypothetical protein [Bryobacteraceae bacterium]
MSIDLDTSLLEQKWFADMLRIERIIVPITIIVSVDSFNSSLDDQIPVPSRSGI